MFVGKFLNILKMRAHFFVIYSVWVARKPPGYAFVEFDDKRDAVDAIKALDGIHYPLI